MTLDQPNVTIIDLYPIFRACPHQPNPAFGFQARWQTCLGEGAEREGAYLEIPEEPDLPAELSESVFVEAWLATETPVSILPRGILDSLGLCLYRYRDWGFPIPTWQGLTFSDIGRVIMSVRTREGVSTMMSVLVVVPRQDPPWLPPAIQLGSQFLVERRAFFNLTCNQELGYFPPFTHSCGLLAFVI